LNQARWSGVRRSALEALPATTILTMATCAAWLVVALFALGNAVAVCAGFVPATVLNSVGAPPGLFLLPFWITPLTSTLVHDGILHLALNMVMLVICGRLLERTIGSWGVVALYVVGAYVAAAGEWVLAPGSLVPTISASGAISALVGAYALLFANQPVPRIGPIPPRVVRVLWLLAAWVAIQLLIGFATSVGGPTIAIGAHIGGFIAGLLLARPLLLWRYRNA
jgi:membrane associated rhomboid family serine protease